MTNRAARRQALRRGAPAHNRAPRRGTGPKNQTNALPGTYLDEMTDRFGDSIRVSPAGQGHVLIEIQPADPNQAGQSVELPESWIPRLFVSAVKATGKNPEDLIERNQS